MTTDKQCRTTAVVTSLLHMQLPSATPQAVLQLCAHLTTCYCTAVLGCWWADCFVNPFKKLHAAAMVCQIQTIGRHPTMIFAKGKEREVDKNKDKDKEKGKREGKSTE
ncbi:unnamed protein product [Sphagnum troendelagicum]